MVIKPAIVNFNRFYQYTYVIGEHIFKKRCQNLPSQKFFGHFNGKKKLQIDPKWSETCKKQETGDTEFSPVASASNQQSTNLPLENVDTSYHIKFPQILSINVAWVPIGAH